jgi:hypothetical protein
MLIVPEIFGGFAYESQFYGAMELKHSLESQE